MPSIFSDHFGTGIATALAGEIDLDRTKRVAVGIGHGRLRYKRARVTIGTAAGIGDQIRLMQFRSSDRIIQVFMTSDGGGDAGAVDIGIYKTGAAHDGAVIDADLFGSAVAVDAAVARVDQFKESAILGDVDRGKTLWELADIGAGTYTVDPMEDWDLVATVTTAVTVALNTTVWEVIYTAGD